MLNLEERYDIIQAKRIVNCPHKDTCNYEKFTTIPFKGTENVHDLFRQVDNSFNSSLIVAGSGDQALEAILHGAKNIATFDINKLAKYGTALKYAAIKALDYKEFLQFYGYEASPFSIKLYMRVREYLDIESRFFWDYLFNHLNGNEIFLHLFDVDNHCLLLNDSFLSIYLEWEYNQIKEKLVTSQISFACCDLKNIASLDFEKNSFDFIYLSNIFYYFKTSPFSYAKFIKNVVAPLMRDDGELFVHYMYGSAGDQRELYSFWDIMLAATRDDETRSFERELMTVFYDDFDIKRYNVDPSGYGIGTRKQDLAISLTRKK